MSYYYKDCYLDNGRWRSLNIKVEEQTTSKIEVSVTNNCRVTIAIDNIPFLWCTPSRDYWGVWTYLKMPNQALDNRIVKPIRANDLAGRAANDLPYWSRFFAQEIFAQGSTFFGSGSWRINRGGEPIYPTEDFISAVYDVNEAFYEDHLRWISWDINGSRSLLALKQAPPRESGRVKWYRKLIQTGECPPVLIWYFSAINAYFVIDGHCRLKAFQLEQLQPTFLVLAEYIEQEIVPDKSRQQSVERAIKERRKHRYKMPLSLEMTNQLLVSAYDDRPHEKIITRSTFRKDCETVWLQELTKHFNTTKPDQNKMEMMLNRISYD